MRFYLEVITVNAELKYKAGFYYFKELILPASSTSSGKSITPLMVQC